MKLIRYAAFSALFVILFGSTKVFAAAPPLDPSFTPGTAFGEGDDTIGFVVVPLSDGKILAGGDFATYDGIARPNLVRLNADGSLDESLRLPGGLIASDEPAIWKAGFQADGKIIVSGNFTTISGVERPGVARLHPDGTLDTQWSPQISLRGQFPGLPVSTLVQPDGRVLAWTVFGIERLQADGSADRSFNVALEGFTLSGVSLQSDGRILLTGALGVAGGIVQSVARLQADGSVDESFSAEPIGSVYGAEEMPNGQILVYGAFDSVRGHSRKGLALLRSDGRLDVSARFKGERDYVWRARALSDGSIAAHFVRGTDFATGFDVTVFSQRRHRMDLKGGSWGAEFTVSLDGYVNDMAEDDSGRLLITGEFTTIDGVSGFSRLARLLRR